MHDITAEPPAIATFDLTKSYGKARGIEKLNLSVAAGEFFGFIGPNGSGKSTTIRTLLGLISPTSGDAQIFGLDIRENKTRILRRIGYLPSEAVFYSDMRVKHALTFYAGLRSADCARESALLCERLELDQRRKISELSFGSKKKAAIVCALQHRPDLLILDEPTSGLDPLIRKEFFAILQERHRQGATIFLSSHVLSEIERYASRAAIIRDGSIIACDAVTDLAKANAKRVRVQGDIQTMHVHCLSGIRDFQRSGDTATFLYGGEIGELLRLLAQSDVRDVSITEPDLEEVILHYYGKDSHSGDGADLRSGQQASDGEGFSLNRYAPAGATKDTAAAERGEADGNS